MNDKDVPSQTPKKKIYLLITEVRLYMYNLLFYLDEYNIIIILGLENIKKEDIVIPCSVEAQSMLYKNNIYNLLDNKSTFYKYLYDNYKNKMEGVCFIPTYDIHYNGKNIRSKFFIKPIDGEGSENQIIEMGYIYEIISKYAKTHQIQDVIDIILLYEINFICNEGNIIGSIIHKTTSSTRKTMDYFFGINSIQTVKLPTGIIELCKTIIKDIKYNGFIGFDFIKDIDGVIYIMECNPRITNSLSNPQYFKKLIEPYYNLKSGFCDSLTKQISYNGDTKINLFNTPNRFYKYFKYKHLK